MICPKCLSQHTEPIVSWTISGRKMTMPQLAYGLVRIENVGHEWPRDRRVPLRHPLLFHALIY